VVVRLSYAPVKIERVLVLTDGSIYSDKALSYSLALAAYLKAKLYLLRILQPLRNAVPGSNAEKSALEYCEATEYFIKLETSQKLGSVEHLMLISRGTIPQVVLEAIKENSIDAIVTGSDEEGYIGGQSAGPLTDDLLKAVSCPVITVGPGISSVPAKSSFQHILCATDFSVGSVRALFYGLLLATKSHGSIGLLHIMKPNGITQDDGDNGSQQRAVEKLYGLIPEEGDSYVTPHTILRFGVPARGITSIAEEERADLITMGIHKSRKSTISKCLPRGVAHYVLSHAHCPVLTVCGPARLPPQTQASSDIKKRRRLHAE